MAAFMLGWGRWWGSGSNLAGRPAWDEHWAGELERRPPTTPHPTPRRPQVDLFGDCALRGASTLEAAAAEGRAVEFENFFSRFALDIIGKVRLGTGRGVRGGAGRGAGTGRGTGTAWGGAGLRAGWHCVGRDGAQRGLR